MSAEAVENKSEQSEEMSIKDRYEKANKEIISRLDQGLLNAIPKEVVARIVVDMFVAQNSLAKLLLEAVLSNRNPQNDGLLVDFVAPEVNRCIAEMWNSGKEWGTTDQPLPEQFHHYLPSDSNKPSNSSPDA